MKVITILFIIFTFGANIYGQQDSMMNVSNNNKSIDSNPTLPTNNQITFPQDHYWSIYLGILSGGDYSNALKSYYKDKGYKVSGFFGFIGLGVHYEKNVYKNLYIYPTFGYYLNLISEKTIYTDLNNYTQTGSGGSMFLLPGFGANYYIPLGSSLFYANLELNHPLFIVDPEDDFSISGQSISISYCIGLEIELSSGDHMGIAIGYSKMNISIKRTNNYSYYYGSNTGTTESSNIGGLSINLNFIL